MTGDPISYGTQGAADALGVSVSKVKQMVQDGEIPHCKVGKRDVILRDDLVDYLERNKRVGKDGKATIREVGP